MMKHMKASEFEEIAVLVGNYPTVDDPQAQKDLDEVKHANPKCLDIYSENGNKSTQRFIGIRELQRRLNPDREEREKGPMRKAFVVRNPLVPKEYFVSSGLDSLVLEMNKHVEHSLLDCPGTYTVKVASFRGETVFAGEQVEKENSRWNPLKRKSENSKLAEAADRAHRLTEALRKRGVEAYEFHDRFESIVTIGSFDEVGTPRADGKTEINPAIYHIMQSYGAERTQNGRFVSETSAQIGAGLRPRTLEGISFDVQPVPVKVPRRSVGDQYAISPGR
jgi:hypothetical protein